VKTKVIKIDHVSEINILIEVLNHYKNCRSKHLDLKVDKLLDVCLQMQKMFMEK